MNIINNLPINKILLISITLLLVGCNDTPSDSNTHTRLKKILIDANGTVADTTLNKIDGYIIQDSITKLEWADESRAFTDGKRTNPQCKPLIGIQNATNHPNIRQEAYDFCQTLHTQKYLGKENWRVPTRSENKTYLLAMKAANRIPFYTNPICGQVISTETNNGTDYNTTKTHNAGADIGKLGTKTGNAGVRCVRRMN